MLSVQSPCFVSIPNPRNQRIMHAGRVLELKDSICVIAMDEPLAIEGGTEAVLLAEWRSTLHQQCARVISVQTTEPLPVIEFERIGEPVNCEVRSTHRVNVASHDIRCDVGMEANCLLADVSAEGVAVIAVRPLRIGSSVAFRTEIEGLRAEGVLYVQTEKKLPSGKLRYGLLAAEKTSPIRRSLERISMLMQRRQLQRQSGAA